MEIFTVKQKPDCAAGSIVQLGMVLQQLEEWNALQGLSLYALNCLSDRQESLLRPRAYSFLAGVALKRREWQQAENLARAALDNLRNIPDSLPQHHAGVLLLLARVQRGRGENQEAVEQLQNARQILLDRWSNLTEDPSYSDLEEKNKEHLYLEILAELRSLYCHSQQYKQAFTLKQEGQFVEHYCGLRAFHGLYPLADSDSTAVGETVWGNVIHRRSQEAIAASGRRAIVEELLEALSRRYANIPSPDTKN